MPHPRLPSAEPRSSAPASVRGGQPLLERTRTRLEALVLRRSCAGAMPSSSTSVKNASAYGDAATRARNDGQSICSRRERAIANTGANARTPIH